MIRVGDFFFWMKPNGRIEIENRAVEQHVSQFVSSMESSILEANLIIQRFNAERIEIRRKNMSQPPFEDALRIERPIRERFNQRRTSAIISSQDQESGGLLAKLRDDEQLEIIKVRMENGILPGSYDTKLLNVYARAFVVTAHLFERYMFQMAMLGDLKAAISSIREEYIAKFPTIKGLRDSLEHSDERVIKKSKGKEIEPDLPVFFLSSIMDDTIVTTMADGSLGSLEISEATISGMIVAMQKVYPAVKFSGSPEIFPR